MRLMPRDCKSQRDGLMEEDGGQISNFTPPVILDIVVATARVLNNSLRTQMPRRPSISV